MTRLLELGARYIDGGSEYHVEASLRAFLVTLLPGIPVVVPDDRQRHERPSVAVQLVGSEHTELGAREYQLEAMYDLSYQGRSYNDTVQVMGRMHQALRFAKMVPLYLYDWRCPRPAVNCLTGTGLPAGDYWLTVSARNQLEPPDESLPCDVLKVTLEQPGVLLVDPPLFPKYGTVTRDYRIWLGTTPDDMRYVGTAPVLAPDGSRFLVVLKDVPPPSPIKPLDRSRFYYRPLHVDQTTADLERWEREPLWDGIVRVNVHCVLTAELYQKPVLRKVIGILHGSDATLVE